MLLNSNIYVDYRLAYFELCGCFPNSAACFFRRQIFFYKWPFSTNSERINATVFNDIVLLQQSV